ncbi:hypothetical protein, partial [Peribacillus butanolivorans]
LEARPGGGLRRCEIVRHRPTPPADGGFGNPLAPGLLSLMLSSFCELFLLVILHLVQMKSSWFLVRI